MAPASDPRPRPRTFLQYAFSRTGFGGTPWPMALVITLGAVGLIVLGLITGLGNGGAWAMSFGVAILSLFIFGTYANFKRWWV